MTMLRNIVTLLLVGLTSLNAQVSHISLLFDESRDTLLVATQQLDSLLLDHLESYRAAGFWDAQVHLTRDQEDQHLLHASVNKGVIPSIRNLHFSGGNARDQWQLKQEYLQGRDAIDALKLKQAENRLRGLGYQLQGEKHVSKDGQGQYHLNYQIANSPKLNLDVLAAFNQNPGSDTLDWFGHINMHVPNLDGKGKSIRLNWKRLKTDSEQFMLSYEHPWLFNNPLKAIFNFGREVVNGNYQLIQGRVGLEWNLDWEHSMIFQYEDHQSLITHDGALLNPEWQASRKQMLGLGYRTSNLDYGEHKGYRMKTSLVQELNFEPSSVSRLDFRSEAELNLIKGLYFSQRTALVAQNQTNAVTDPSILMPLGGVNSVRGYEENLLRSTSVMSLQNDLHLPLGNQSELIALMDVGLYYESRQIEHLTGFGFGVQLRTANGPIRIILASHSGVELRNSFLHIEYSGGHSWIDR